MTQPIQTTQPPSEPDSVDVKAIPKTLPADREGLKRLRGKMLSLMEESFEKLNDLVPEKPSVKGPRTATDDRKLLETAEELLRTLGRAKNVAVAIDQLLATPGAAQPKDAVTA